MSCEEVTGSGGGDRVIPFASAAGRARVVDEDSVGAAGIAPDPPRDRSRIVPVSLVSRGLTARTFRGGVPVRPS
jgi:hypothetical protein